MMAISLWRSDAAISLRVGVPTCRAGSGAGSGAATGGLAPAGDAAAFGTSEASVCSGEGSGAARTGPSTAFGIRIRRCGSDRRRVSRRDNSNEFLHRGHFDKWSNVTRLHFGHFMWSPSTLSDRPLTKLFPRPDRDASNDQGSRSTQRCVFVCKIAPSVRARWRRIRWQDSQTASAQEVASLPRRSRRCARERRARERRGQQGRPGRLRASWPERPQRGRCRRP